MYRGNERRERGKRGGYIGATYNPQGGSDAVPLFPLFLFIFLFFYSYPRDRWDREGCSLRGEGRVGTIR